MSPRPTTTEAGLGAEQQRRRRETPVPFGEPCPFAGIDPLCPGVLLPGQRLQLDHVVARALGGADGPVRWAHGRCNEAAGARLGNQLRARKLGRRWVDRWA